MTDCMPYRPSLRLTLTERFRPADGMRTPVGVRIRHAVRSAVALSLARPRAIGGRMRTRRAFRGSVGICL